MSDSKYYVILNPEGQQWTREQTAREASDRHRFIGAQRDATARTNTDGTQSIVEVGPRDAAPTGVRIVAGPFDELAMRRWIAARVEEWSWTFPGEEEPIR